MDKNHSFIASGRLTFINRDTVPGEHSKYEVFNFVQRCTALLQRPHRKKINYKQRQVQKKQ